MRSFVLFVALCGACASSKDTDADPASADDTDAGPAPADDTDAGPAPADDTDAVPAEPIPTDDTDGEEAPTDPDVSIVEISGARQWSDGTVASSCREYLDPPPGYAYDGATGDGAYVISPDGVSFATTYCDMTVDGGGWTLVAQMIPTTSGPDLCLAAAGGTLDLDRTTVNGPAKLSDAFIQAVWADGPEKELHLRTDFNSAVPTRTGWNHVCTADFVDEQTFDLTAAWNSWNLEQPLVCNGVAQSETPTAFADAALCGYRFVNYGSSRYTAWSSYSWYTDGACAPASSGRSWVDSTGNAGCNVSKVFAR